MFDTAITVDRLESELLDCEAAVDRLRARQLELLRALDAAQVAAMDGSRSMIEWTAARLDVAPDTARHLVRAARRLADHPDIESDVRAGLASLDRAVATARLADAGADEQELAASRGYDIAGVHRPATRHRRMARGDEQRAFGERFFTMQPTLDVSSWRLWGQLPGYKGQLLHDAVHRRADLLPDHPDGRPSRGQRCADALVAMAQDSMGGDDAEPSVPLVTVFVDAGPAAATAGEAGAEVAGGVKVGPDTLERILCGGSVEVTSVAGGVATPLGRTGRALSPRLRRYVLWRDGGCAADGCGSRYRLQPHHVRPRSAGGSDDPENLVALWWYHHHVVIHGEGYRIDPASPPRRMRFLRPRPGRAPP